MNKAPYSLLFLCCLIFACEEAPALRHIIKFDKDAFDRERAAWKAQPLHKYQMEEEIWGVILLVRAKVTVQNEEIRVVEALSKPQSENKLCTISEVYNNVDNFYNNFLQIITNTQERMELKIDIRYNTDYHYPEEVGCYYYSLGPKEGPVDGQGAPGFTIYIADFTPLSQ